MSDDVVPKRIRLSTVYLPVGTRHIHCTQAISESRALVVLCNPLWNERAYVSPLYHALMKSLAIAGFDVVLFDWTGQGNSSGESWDMSADTMRSDIDAVTESFRPNPNCPSVMVACRAVALVTASFPNATNVLIDPIVDAAKWFRSLLLLERTKEIVAYRKSALSAAAFAAGGDRITLCETVIGTRLYADLLKCSGDFKPPQNVVEIGLASRAPLAVAPDRWIDLQAHNQYREAIWQTPGKITPSMCAAVCESTLQALDLRNA